jgi:transmembrane sensor
MAEEDRSTNPASPADWDAIARIAAGECTPEQHADVRRALAADPVRAALVAALNDALTVGDVAAPTASEVEAALLSVRGRRSEAGDAQGVAEPRRAEIVSLDSYRRRWYDARLVAAAAVLVVAGAGLVWRAASNPAARTATGAAPAHFASAVGAIDSLRLPDGSRVLLGPGSELTLAAGFGGATREATLRGEARFDVVHDASRPFIVHTPAASFRDVGTIFSVHSDAGDGARIVVSAGAVAVQTKSGAAAVTLQAGDRADVAMGGALRVERSAATREDLEWTSGRLVFRDAPVAQVAADLRRWYGLELVVDSALAGRHLTATFERGARAEVGTVVAAVLGGAFQLAGDTVRIVATSRTPKQ